MTLQQSSTPMASATAAESGAHYSHDGADDPTRVGETPRFAPPALSTTMPRAPYPPRNVYLSPWLVVILSYLATVFLAVSLGVPWWRRRQYAPAAAPPPQTSSISSFTFLRTVTVTTAPPHRRVVAVADYCRPVRHRAWAALCFLFLSLALALGVAVVSTAAAAAAAAPPPRPTTRWWWPHRLLHLLAGGLVVALTAAMALGLNIFLWSFAECGGANSSYHSQLYEPHVGMGLAASAWALSAVGGLLAANPFSIPCDARAVNGAAVGFASLSALTLLFVTVACANVPHWYYKDARTQTVTDVSLWHTSVHAFGWNVGAGLAPRSPTRTTTPAAGEGGDCAPLANAFRVARGLGIVSAAAYLGASVTGYLVCKHIIFTRVVSLGLSYTGFVAIVAQVALEGYVYRASWCDGTYAYAQRYYTLAAGFALVATAAATSLLSCMSIAVVYVLTTHYFPSKAPYKTIRQLAREVYN